MTNRNLQIEQHVDAADPLVVLPSGSFPQDRSSFLYHLIYQDTKPHKCGTTSLSQPQMNVTTSRAYLNLRYLCLLLSMLIMMNTLTAATVDDLYNKMISAYGKLNSWQGTVSQTNVYKQSGSSLKSTGTFYFQKGKLAIRYNKPNEQHLIVQNGKLSVYDKANNTVFTSTLDSAIGSLNPVEIVKSYWAKSQHKLLSTAGGFSEVKLTPSSDPNVRDITLKIETKTGYIHSLQYSDKQGNSMSIAFTKIKLNPTIAASVFKLSYPKTAKVFAR